ARAPPRTTRSRRPANARGTAGATPSGKKAHEARSDRVRDGERQMTPQPRSPGQATIVRRRRSAPPVGGVLTPWQRHVDAPPLLLKAVRPTVTGAASKVEHPRAAPDHVLHEPPVQQHVRRDATRLAQRTRPRHFEFIAPDECAATRERLFTLVDDFENDQLRK